MQAPEPVTFDGFVRLHTQTLLRIAYLLTGEPATAEDLVQDTLLRLYPRWAKVAAADAPLAYVRRSLTNVFINRTRRAWRREHAFAVVPECADQHDAVAQLDDRDELWAGLRTLPDRQRAALVLRFFEDLTDEQSAAVLDCRVGTVRSLVSRGLATLREHLPADQRPPEGRTP